MWPDADRPSHDHATCARFLDRFLLPPRELLAALAPEGWVRSLLVRVFHPTPEQLAEESERIRRNLAALTGRPEPDASDEDEASEDVEEPLQRSIEPEREVVELLGRALWDVFSENHRVIDSDGTAYHLGSFRASAALIAESINRRYTHLERPYDYLDFYMGSSLSSQRADLRPVYRWIFARLQILGCRWIYSFPRIYLVDLGGLAPDEDASSYDPSEAVRHELESAERARRTEELADELERGYREDVRRARHAPLPTIVAAYRDVFGTLPEGWPHPDM